MQDNFGQLIHFEEVERGFEKQKWRHVGATGDELIELLGSFRPFGIWRAELETGLVFWSEDVYRIHGMEPSTEPVSLAEAINRYHPDDATMVAQLIETVSRNKSGYRFVLRLRRPDGSYKLVASAGRYRPDNGGELYGFFHEYQPNLRSVLLTGGAS